MRWKCRERFPRHRLQRKPLVSDAGMHHGTCVTHVPWCMSGLLTRGGGENVPGIPSACATRNFTYLARATVSVTKWLCWNPKEYWSNRLVHIENKTKQTSQGVFYFFMVSLRHIFRWYSSAKYFTGVEDNLPPLLGSQALTCQSHRKMTLLLHYRPHQSPPFYSGNGLQHEV